MLKAAILFLAVAAVAPPVQPLQPRQQTVGVQDKKPFRDSEYANTNAEKSNGQRIQPKISKPISVPPRKAPECNYECERRAEERSEYWVVLGHRLKITDFLLVVFNLLLLGVSVLSVLVLRSTDLSTRKSADAAVMAQRPWIRLDVSVNGDFIDYGGGFRLPLKVNLINIGNTPALDVRPWAVLIGGGNSLDFGKALKISPKEPEGIGYSLFPNDPSEEQIFGTLFREDAEEALKAAFNANHIYVGLLVWVSYRFSAGGVGKTSRLFHVVGPGMMGQCDLRKFPIDADTLSLSPLPMQDVAT